jgi:hypothetical protein
MKKNLRFKSKSILKYILYVRKIYNLLMLYYYFFIQVLEKCQSNNQTCIKDNNSTVKVLLILQK